MGRNVDGRDLEKDAITLSVEKNVIDKAYEIILKPESFYEFEEVWDKYIDVYALGHSQVLSDENFSEDTSLNEHISRAIEITDRMGIQKPRHSHAQNIVDNTNGFGLILNKLGDIKAYNVDAAPIAKASKNIKDLDFDDEVTTNLLQWIRRDFVVPNKDVLFLDTYYGAEQKFMCLFVIPIKVSDNSVATHQFHFLVTSVNFELDLRSVGVIMRRFELTKAESEIAIHLANGLSNRDISDVRGVSKETVDKQVKIIRSKTNSKSIVDLVRKLGLMSAKVSAVSSQAMQTNGSREKRHVKIKRSLMTLRDGRQYEYMEQGHPRGQVVLNIHKYFENGQITPDAELRCFKKGWRFISPSRHGYGASDCVKFSDLNEMVDKSVDDFCELLDHLNIDKAIIINGKYGQRFALRYPDRTQSLICINDTPQWHSSFLKCLDGRQRRLIASSIYAPIVNRYLAKVSYILTMSGKSDVLIKALHDAEVDREALKNADIYHIVEEGLRHSVNQGVESHLWDLKLAHKDQSADAYRLNRPVSILYGQKCSFPTPVVVDSYASMLNIPRVREIQNAGQYLMHTHFHEVLNELELYRQ